MRDFNNATKAGENLAGGINRLAQALNSFDVGGFIDKISRAKAASDEWLRGLGNAQVFEELNRLLGVTDQNGQLINPDVAEAEGKIAGLEREVDLLQKAIAQNTELGFDNSAAIARLAEVRGELARLRAEAQGLPAVVQGVRPSGEVLPFPGDDPNGTNGQMGGPALRGGRRNPVTKEVGLDKSLKKNGASKSDGYKSAIEDLTRETAALEQKRAALASLNPLAADYAQQVDAVEVAQRLLTEAQEAGKAVGAELSDVQRLLTGDLTGLTPAAKAQAEAIREVALANAAATASYEALQKSSRTRRRRRKRRFRTGCISRRTWSAPASPISARRSRTARSRRRNGATC
ncbi:hypothetical protein [Rhizobium sp. G21]|uniref:hypothetical protein n=1 Tax=Rhizobium sp. G21 TaxID=2758439 RepID=UPI0016012EE9|nr:hypothetical protein [Rhizobium sp. G21]MBB1247460.1 hypothetical protein [Rhizobium sp. G21]